MKKSLVLAMAMALGVTASAYAANPFSDVPAGHWAYDSVAKLAAAGVVDGYADGAFAGDKLITRYEMAQIVAKAMAKGADCDKLAAEFADELDTLGVRVAKLEKGADAVKIAGQFRARYQSHEGSGDSSDLRTRLWVSGQVNDDWTYTAMLQSVQNIDNNAADNKVDLNRAYLDGKVGGLAVHAGRWDEVTASGAVLDTYLDGVKVSYGKDVKVWALAAKGANVDDTCTGSELTYESDDRIYAVGVETKIGAFDVYANWFKVSEGYLNGANGSGKATDAYYDNDKSQWVEAKADPDDEREYGEKEVYNVALGLDVAKDTRLTYEYMWGDKKYNKDVAKDGYIIGLTHKGADAAVAGSYGLHAYLYDQPVNAWLSPTFDLTNFNEYGGYEGWSVGVDYTVAKNVQLCVNYYDTESKTGNKDDQSIFTELYFMF